MNENYDEMYDETTVDTEEKSGLGFLAGAGLVGTGVALGIGAKKLFGWAKGKLESKKEDSEEETKVEEDKTEVKSESKKSEK